MNDRSKSFGQPQSEKCSRIKSAPPNQTRVFGDWNRADTGVHSSVAGGARRAVERDRLPAVEFQPARLDK
jgi:hypothetical protein